MGMLEGRDKGAFLMNPADGSLLIGTGGQFDLVKNFRVESQEVFYLKDFYSDQFLRYAPEKIVTLSQAEVTKLVNELPATGPEFQCIGSEDHTYKEDFPDLMKAFSGNLRKVVMISRENYSADSNDSTPFYLMKKALTFGAGIPYGLWGKEFGIIGSTPEELFSSKNGELHTHALAGTAKKGLEEELLHSQKDLLEHNLVIQDISEKLMPFSDKVQVSETKIYGFKDIIHLKTNIDAAVSDDVDMSALVSALSPTAALGGYPKKESFRFLRETRYFKKYPERSFGSAMGVVTKNEARFVVMIRNVQWKKNTFFIECGGGVVPGSELVKELDEIALKRNIVKEHYL